MIKAQNIVKKYQLGKVEINALNGVSLHIKKGDFVCIAGKSGSGKTTLLNILGCLDKQDSGDYTVDNILINTIKLRKLYKIRRKYIGFIFQDFNLIPVLTAYENVEYPLVLAGVNAKKRKELTELALNEVELYDRKNHKPSELSGGQQQRISIARALVNRPPVILADEPTANLDTNTSLKIIDLLKRLNEKDNIAFVFSTHDNEIMEKANIVFRLRDGVFN